MLQNIPHQIVQSPARLGLPNPNSPSLSNSTPPKPPSQTPQSQSILSNAPKVPSTLISLLPPLPRAQSLLLQMASLSSKLFELSPKKSHWLTSFRGSLPTFLSSQPISLNPSTNNDSLKEIIPLFSTLQTQLFESVAELQEILDLQDTKHKVVRDIHSKDSVILAFANKLKEAEHVLDMLVDDYADYRQPKRSKTSDDHSFIASKINLSDILSYAHRISYTTFAPPEFGAGQAPLRGALPPAPQEEQLRASQLYRFSDLDVGLPKTEKEKEKTIETLVVSPPESNPHPNLSAITGLIPSNITVPSGWKPGMPVELPAEFPILPPAGWKPGDPVILPELESLTRVAEVQPARPIGPRQGVLPRVAEPIQVPHVSLDILDQDDDSSDFSSSDSGSSEDDD